MPKRCPLCRTELFQGEYCPTCKRRVVEEILEAEVEMLESAIEGWREQYATLQDELRLAERALPSVDE